MFLKNKTAIVYGATGGIGSSVSRSLAREGAHVILVARGQDKLDKLAAELRNNGGSVETKSMDALDETAMIQFANEVAGKAGRIDIAINVISIADVQGALLREMNYADFVQPIEKAMHAQFITAKAVSPHMVKQRSGVILMVTATPARMAFERTGGFGPACAAMEGMSRILAAELGTHGVRVNVIRSSGSPDSEEAATAGRNIAEGAGMTEEEITNHFLDFSLLKRNPMLKEIGDIVAFAASDYASIMTGTVFNATGGSIVD
ncbi:MAG TPA: SDR family oxidoreductase [Chitinophagaceae bacterium]|jgi:NAD(P)-dependent dehydrogenase (short-subunit alcohol dehydrogenase family)|nr:SDR family oxidoreductase [Chitinophagaceae bacterium]